MKCVMVVVYLIQDKNSFLVQMMPRLLPICCEIFKAIEFTALGFTATQASPATKRTQILPMTQHTRLPISF
jgi:hypothetical protein